MMDEYDLLVLGSGSAASHVAVRCSEAGWHVGVVDPNPFGGTCRLGGSHPKQVLVRAAELLDWLRRFGGKGVRAPEAQIDWAALQTFKRSFTSPVSERTENRYRDAGITLLHAEPRFSSPNSVVLGERDVHSRRFFVASGARPARLNIPGEEYLMTSGQFLELVELPKRIVFVGGGYVSFELAHVAVRAGAQVALVDKLPRPLLHFDPDLVDRLIEHTSNLGIDLHLTTQAKSIERQGDGSYLVRAITGNEEREFAADLVVHGAGRTPNIDGLELEAAEVLCTSAGVEVNEYFQSLSNPAVYSAGDVADTGAPTSSSAADLEGQTAACNLLEGNLHQADYRGMPVVLSTIPALAAVGLGVEQAKEKNLRFSIHQGDRGQWTSMKKVAERTAHYKVLVEEGTGHILGAHLLGPDAAETINLFALAIRHGLTASDVKTSPLAYPTFCEDIRSML